jgi:hypothetical protein
VAQARAQHQKKKLHPSIGLLILALLVAAIGFGINAQGVSCGGEKMTPGSACVSDKGDRRTYAEVKNAAETAPLIFGGAGGVLALLAVVVAVRRKAAPAPQPAPESNSAAS